MDTIKLTNIDTDLYINGLNTIPVGSIMCFGGSNAPQGWLLCNGLSKDKNNYPSLFSVIGYTYGGSGNTFNLPNLQNRFPMGAENNNLGNIGGSNSITLNTSQLPSHTHTTTVTSNGSHSHTGSTTSDGSHNHSINDPGHTHTQWTINDDFNNSGGSNPSFSADSSGYRTWSNINSSTTGITINSAGDHSHSLTTNTEPNHTHTVTIDSTGNGDLINITNKYITLNYIIRY